MALDRSDGVAVADPRAARPRRRAELRPRTLIRRFEPGRPKRAKGAPRASPAALRDGRGAAPTLPTSPAPGEDARCVNYDDARTGRGSSWFAAPRPSRGLARLC